MTSGLTPGEFDALFQRFADSPTATTVFRWEGLPQYAIPSDEPSLVAFRAGTPRPERSVRTSPWLRRIALSVGDGKSWTRARRPADTEYFRWELVAYVESQAAGEHILLADAPAYQLPDFWLFGGHRAADRFAVAMHYDDAGAPIEFEYVDNPRTLNGYARIAAELIELGQPLNDYLAARQVSGAA